MKINMQKELVFVFSFIHITLLINRFYSEIILDFFNNGSTKYSI